jgi:hypothetical protein
MADPPLAEHKETSSWFFGAVLAINGNSAPHAIPTMAMMAASLRVDADNRTRGNISEAPGR